MNIDRIINESINRVITEGYSGKYAEDWLTMKVMPKVTRWLKGVKANKPNVDRTFRTFAYTNGYGFNEKLTMLMRGRNTHLVQIIICYFPDKVFLHGVGGRTEHPSLDGKEIKILLNVNKECDPSFIYRALLHEITHAIDIIIGRRNGRPFYYGYTHQDYLFKDHNLPSCITNILYCLWDASEFNAWQAYLKSDVNLFNGHFEKLMKYLTEADKIDDEETWDNLRKYLTSRVDFFFRFRTTDWIKKYFINTSFKLLKKFTKKVKLL